MLCIAWTTVAKSADAERLASESVARGLAACVQIDGPVISHYKWNGAAERAEEFRLSFKCPADRVAALEAYVLAHHSYETPEWVVIRADHVAEKYLSWAKANSSTRPL